jgi:hypothetical protein
MCAVAVFFWHTYTAPHGQWDGWGIHNLHARFLYRGQNNWHDLFTTVLIWTHPDYPLLVPAFIASWWKLLGNEYLAVPAATAFLFTFGSIGLVTSSLVLLRGRRTGLLAGLAMLTAPNFIAIGAGQLADVPLSWFLVAASVLLTMDYPAAAGVAAGLLLWTKNDGTVLFLAVVIGPVLAFQWSSRRIGRFTLGVLAPLTLCIWFKLTSAVPNPMLSRTGAIDRVLDGSRYLAIANGFVRHLWSFGGLFVSPVLILLCYLALMRTGKGDRGPVRAVALTLAVALSGYAAVYLLTVYDVVQLIDGSLDRLLVHLWPTAVFVTFLSARTHTEEPPSPSIPAIQQSSQRGDEDTARARVSSDPGGPESQGDETND